jgi:hypothetical protein
MNVREQKSLVPNSGLILVSLEIVQFPCMQRIEWPMSEEIIVNVKLCHRDVSGPSCLN